MRVQTDFWAFFNKLMIPGGCQGWGGGQVGGQSRVKVGNEA